MIRNTLVFTVLAAFFLVYAESKGIIRKVDDGSINWTDGTIMVTGSGAPDIDIENANSARLFSNKVAEKNAKYRLRKIMEKISVDGDITVGKFIEKRKDIGFEVPGDSNDTVREVSRKNYSDGSVDIKFSYSIIDSIHEICTRYREELQKKSVSTKVIRNLPVDEKVLFSKLVIEVAQKKFSPVLFPRIVSEREKVVYGLEKVEQIGACSKLVKYVEVYDKDDALHIKAEKIGKKGEIIITDEDELKVMTQLKENVIKNGNVLILLK